MISVRSSSLFSRPLHGLHLGGPADPSDESLGYSQPSANRGLTGADFSGKAAPRLFQTVSRFSFAFLLNLLLNPRIKLFSERLFIASPFPVHDDSQRVRWLRTDIDLRHTAFDPIPPRIRLDSDDVAISFEQTQ